MFKTGSYNIIVYRDGENAIAVKPSTKEIIEGPSKDHAQVIRGAVNREYARTILLLGSFNINSYTTVDGLDVGIPIRDSFKELYIKGELRATTEMDSIIYAGRNDTQIFDIKIIGGLLKGLKDESLQNYWEKTEHTGLPDYETGSNYRTNGIIVSGVRDSVFMNIKLVEFARSGLVVGYSDIPAENNYFVNIHVRGSGNNGTISGEPEKAGVEIYRPDNNFINILSWWSKENGILVDGSKYDTWTYEAMMNIHTYANEKDGLYLLNSNRLTILGFYSEYNGRYGLHLVGDSKTNIIGTGVLWDNGKITGQNVCIRFSEEHPGWSADNYLFNIYVDGDLNEKDRGGAGYPNSLQNINVTGAVYLDDSTEKVSIIHHKSKNYRYNTQGGSVTLSGDGSTTDFKIASIDIIPEITDASKVVLSCTPVSSDALSSSPIVCYVTDDDGDGKFDSIYARFYSAPKSGTNNVVLSYKMEYNKVV